MLVDQSTNGTFVITRQGEELFVRRDSAQLSGELHRPAGDAAVTDPSRVRAAASTDAQHRANFETKWKRESARR